MTNFESTSGLFGSLVVAGTSLIALKLTTDFLGNAINNTQKSLPKSNKRSPKPFRVYPKFNDYNYYGYPKKKRKSQNIFAIDF